eukprot:scaffold97624_cov49-Prasinocladus_malaysianus.AAC.1
MSVVAFYIINKSKQSERLNYQWFCVVDAVACALLSCFHQQPVSSVFYPTMEGASKARGGASQHRQRDGAGQHGQIRAPPKAHANIADRAPRAPPASRRQPVRHLSENH